MARAIVQLAALVLSWIASTAAAEPAAKLKIAYVPVSGSAALFMAKDKGFFEKNGLDVELIFARSAVDIIPGLISNSFQIGMLPDSSLVQAAASGLDIVAVNGNLWLRTGTKDSALVAKTGSDIKSAQDLKDKRIALISIGSISQVLFEKWLMMKGLDRAAISTIKYAEVPPPQQVDIIKTGTVDGVIAVDPFVNVMLKQGSGYIVSYFMGEMPDKTQAMLNATSRQWADKNPKEIAAFRKALEESTSYALANEKETRETMIRWLKLPPDVVNTTRFPDLTTEVTVKDMKWWIDTLNEQGRLQTKISPEKLLLK